MTMNNARSPWSPGVEYDVVSRPQAGGDVRNVKADVLERFVPGYQRANVVDIIEDSPWPESASGREATEESSTSFHEESSTSF
jgi:hypothetical protein